VRHRHGKSVNTRTRAARCSSTSSTGLGNTGYTHCGRDAHRGGPMSDSGAAVIIGDSDQGSSNHLVVRQGNPRRRIDSAGALGEVA